MQGIVIMIDFVNGDVRCAMEAFLHGTLGGGGSQLLLVGGVVTGVYVQFVSHGGVGDSMG